MNIYYMATIACTCKPDGVACIVSATYRREASEFRNTNEFKNRSILYFSSLGWFVADDTESRCPIHKLKPSGENGDYDRAMQKIAETVRTCNAWIAGQYPSVAELHTLRDGLQSFMKSEGWKQERKTSCT